MLCGIIQSNLAKIHQIGFCKSIIKASALFLPSHTRYFCPKLTRLEQRSHLRKLGVPTKEKRCGTKCPIRRDGDATEGCVGVVDVGAIVVSGEIVRSGPECRASLSIRRSVCDVVTD